jgi:hypothetical protein
MKKLTEQDLNRLVKKILNEDLDMEVLRKSVEDYKKKSVQPISKKTGEPLKTHEVPFHGYYNIKDTDLPLNVRSFFNDFKKKLGVFNIKPSKISKEKILDVIDQILTLNGFE